MRCVECGCTEERACVHPSGRTCSWASTDPPLCTACQIGAEMEGWEHPSGTDFAIFRVYEPDECGKDGYPFLWHKGAGLWARDEGRGYLVTRRDLNEAERAVARGIKDIVRWEAGSRCIRCGHPYTRGCGTWEDAPDDDAFREALVMQMDLGGDLEHPSDKDHLDPRNKAVLWSRCDEECTHLGPYRMRAPATGRRHHADGLWTTVEVDTTPLSGGSLIPDRIRAGYEVQAAWRILTVHHLNERKFDCRWFNLVALCQRDHLIIQRKVTMDSPYPWPHSEWFRPYAAAHYAVKYGVNPSPSREWTERHLDELLELGRHEESVERMAL